MHKPVADGACDGCHDPHGAASPFSLKTGAGAAACASCHPKVASSGKPHRALERYGCTGCHEPHGTANISMIKTAVEIQNLTTGGGNTPTVAVGFTARSPP